MPACNAGKYTAATIKSVLSQLYAYWELLMMAVPIQEKWFKLLSMAELKCLPSQTLVYLQHDKDLEQMSGSFFCFYIVCTLRDSC